jgi:hypothetical protein
MGESTWRVVTGVLGVLLMLAPSGRAEETRWALLVGIDEYNEESKGLISPLRGSVMDVEAIEQALVTEGGFEPDQVIVLRSDRPGRKPTLERIRQQLRFLGDEVDTDDLVYLHFSLHSVLDARSGRTFLLPWDAPSPKSKLASRALSLDEVTETLGAMFAPKRLMVLDGCRNDPEPGRGDTDNTLWEGYLASAEDEMLFEMVEPAEAVSFVQVLLACDVGERAYEIPETGRGLFSTALEEALTGHGEGRWGDGEVTLGELVDWVEERVPKLAARYLPEEARQHPKTVMHLPGDDEGVSGAGRDALVQAARAYRLTTVDPRGLRDITPAPRTTPVQERGLSSGGSNLAPVTPTGYFPPTMAITSPPPASLTAEAAGEFVVRFEAKAFGDDLTYHWRLDDLAPRETLDAEVTLSVLDPGAHTLRVEARDGFGGVSDAVEARFTVLANRAPSVSFVHPAPGARIKEPSLKVVLEGSDPEGSELMYRLALDTKDLILSSRDGSFELKDGLGVGGHKLLASCVDAAGEESFWIELPFTVEDVVDPLSDMMAEGWRLLARGAHDEARKEFERVRRVGDTRLARTWSDFGKAECLHANYIDRVNSLRLPKALPLLQEALDLYEKLDRYVATRDDRELHIQAYALYRVALLNGHKAEFYKARYNKQKVKTDHKLWGRARDARDAALDRLSVEYGEENDEHGEPLWQRARSEVK